MYFENFTGCAVHLQFVSFRASMITEESVSTAGLQDGDYMNLPKGMRNIVRIGGLPKPNDYSSSRTLLILLFHSAISA